MLGRSLGAAPAAIYFTASALLQDKAFLGCCAACEVL